MSELAESGQLSATQGPATFRRDTLRYALAVLADRLTAFILLPLLTSALDKRDFGAWSQIQSAYGFLSTVLLSDRRYKQ